MQFLGAWLRHAALLRSARTSLFLGASHPRAGFAGAPPHALRACLVPPQMHRYVRDAALGRLHRNDANAERGREQLEVTLIRRDDCCAVALRGQTDQRVVLKFAALGEFPILLVADAPHEIAGLPPVSGGWLPAHLGERMQRIHKGTALVRASTAA